MRKVVAVDTETTGLGEFDRGGRRPDAVVQIGAAWRDNNGKVVVWERVCNPGREFMEGGRATEALALSGLTVPEVLKAEGAAKVARDFRSLLSKIRTAHGSIEICAFNVEFDRAFLSVSPWNLKAGWGPCLMIEAARFLGYDTARVSLSKAADLIGVPVQGRPHTAGSDARTALLLHERVTTATKKTAERPTSRAVGGAVSRQPSGYRAGCELCENFGPHDGEHGYFQEGEFYSFDE